MNIEDSDQPSTPPELCAISDGIIKNLLPDKSRNAYEITHDRFMQWRELKQATSFSDRVLISYFTELSKKWAPSTLWSEFSKLKSTLKIKNNIDISSYSNLVTFKKKMNKDFKPKKAATLTASEVRRFLEEASDTHNLATKVSFS